MPDILVGMFDLTAFERFFAAWKFLFVTLAPVLPFITGYLAAQAWLKYKRAMVYTNWDTVLLEIKVPAEVNRSPAAMEGVLDNLHIKPGEGTFYKKWWRGGVRIWFSLELVSFEGEVHFFIWLPRQWQRYVEASFYAFYPDIEIVEVPDYAHRFTLDLEQYNLYGVNYKFQKPDAYPIKTYVEYGLDKPPQRDEEKTDPLAAIIEQFSAIGPGEQLWMQFIFQFHTELGKKPGAPYEQWDVRAQAKNEVNKIRKSPEAPVVLSDNTVIYGVSQLQLKKIEIIERAMYSKHIFDLGIRGLYIAKRQQYASPNEVKIKNIFQVYASDVHNNIQHMGDQGLAKFDFEVQDYLAARENMERYRLFDAYRKRSWFHPPYRFKKMAVSTEELATLFHMPNQVIKTPGLSRIPSARKEAPPNLPT